MLTLTFFAGVNPQSGVQNVTLATMLVAVWTVLLFSTAQACQWDLAVAQNHQQCTTLPCDTKSRLDIADEDYEHQKLLMKKVISRWIDAHNLHYPPRTVIVRESSPEMDLFAFITMFMFIIAAYVKTSRHHQKALDNLKDILAAPDAVCSICWDENGPWKGLPCQHVFHGPCIERWFEERTTCPNCRRDVSIPGVSPPSV